MASNQTEMSQATAGRDDHRPDDTTGGVPVALQDGPGVPGMQVLHLCIPGKPIAQGRPRGFSPKNSPAIRFYDPQAKEKKQVSWVMSGATNVRGISCPVIVTMEFIMPVVSGMLKKVRDQIAAGDIVPHVKKPDVDNMLKFYMDCVSMSGIWRDDSVVSCLYCRKYYGFDPRTEIRIEQTDG